MTARNVSLTDNLMKFVDLQVQTGRHQDASQVVEEALRRYADDIATEAAQIREVRDHIEDGRRAIADGNFRLVAGEVESAALLARLTRRRHAE